jgi:predicted LPLAT superfamily acyltransferase
MTLLKNVLLLLGQSRYRPSGEKISGNSKAVFMVEGFHKFIVRVSGLVGPWFFRAMSWIITTGFFIFIPRRVLAGTRFYRVLFPGRNFSYYLGCTWKQYHNFTKVIMDRMMLLQFGDITYTSKGLEQLERSVRDGTGGVIIMSHMGNWDVAAHLLKDKGLPLLLYMGKKDKEAVEKIQKENLEEKGLRIIAVGTDGGSPMDIVEGFNFIKDGGLVAITGDVLWGKNQRLAEARFLGHSVKLPAAPYVLALKTGAPFYIFFAFRTGEKKYHIYIEEPVYVREVSRKERESAITGAAQHYAEVLERTLRQYPLQWYHFNRFLEKKIDED